MNIQNIRTLLDTVAVPNTARTLGGEKAVRSVGQRSDGIHIALHFGFPVAHIAAALADAVQETLMPETGGAHIHLSMDTEIGTHKVRPGVTTIKGVKNIIAVASGKGGVGKST
ncbi:iron-sulfur cluster carrier protein ApbC, partial [Neisseria gonorrhoeae]